MKRGLTLAVLSIFLIGFVNAAITDVFDRMGDDLVYLVLFVILFSLLIVILTRTGFFRDAYGNPNTASAAVISLAISALAVYGIYRSGFSVEGIFFDFGFTPDSLSPILWIALLALIGFLIWKFSFGSVLMVAGTLLALAALFTDFIYEKTTALTIGIIMIVGGFLWLRSVRKKLIASGKWAGRRQWTGRSLTWIVGMLVIMFGVVIKQPIVWISGIVITLVGVWLWWRKKPGLYRPIAGDWDFKYSPIQEKRQFKRGNAMMFSGILLIIFGFVLQAYWGAGGTTVLVFGIIGGIVFVIGLIAKIVY